MEQALICLGLRGEITPLQQRNLVKSLHTLTGSEAVTGFWTILNSYQAGSADLNNCSLAKVSKSNLDIFSRTRGRQIALPGLTPHTHLQNL
jgi:hypothetical protein